MAYYVNTVLNQPKIKRTKLTIAAMALTAVAFVALLAITIGRVGAAGNTLVVDDDGMAVAGNCNSTTVTPYTTVSAAVTAAVAGDTVKVCPGTYAESVLVDKALTVKGAKAGSNPGGRTFAGPNESTVDGSTPGSAAFTVNAADVTIDGFSVTNPDEGLGIVVKTAGNNAVIKKNIVDGVGGAAFMNHTVGIYLELGPDNVKLISNKIGHVQSATAGAPGTAQGVLVGDSTSSDPSLGVRIEDNTIADITSAARGAYGIQLNNGSSTAPTATGYTTAKVLGNTIKDLNGGGWVHAIGLEGDTPNIQVKKNTISNLVDGTPAPINDAIGVFFESNVFFFTGDVNQNSLDVGATAFGIAVHPALTTLYPTLSADGTCNWWGHRSGPGPVGPGSGSMVTAGVDFKPWLKSANLHKGNCGEQHHHDYNDHNYGHGWDDKDRWNGWDD